MKPTILLYDYFYEKAMADKFHDLFSFYNIAFNETRQDNLSTARKLITSIFVKEFNYKEKDVKIKLKIQRSRVHLLFVKIKNKELQFEIDYTKCKVKVLR